MDSLDSAELNHAVGAMEAAAATGAAAGTASTAAGAAAGSSNSGEGQAAAANANSGSAVPARPPLPVLLARRAGEDPRRASNAHSAAHNSDATGPVMKEISLRHGLVPHPEWAAAHSSSRLASEDSDHVAPLLPRHHAQGSAAVAGASSSAGGGGSSSEAATGGWPPAAAEGSTHNPLFVPAAQSQPPLPQQQQPGLTMPIPYRTVSTESYPDAGGHSPSWAFMGRSPAGSTPHSQPHSDTSLGERVVVQHSLAGDLHLPAAVAAAAAAGGAASVAGAAAVLTGPGQSPGRTLSLAAAGAKGVGETAPLQRQAGTLGSGALSGGRSAGPSRQPSHKSGLGGEGAVPVDKGIPPSDSSDDEFAQEDFDLHLEERAKPWYKRKRFWKVAVSVFITLFFSALGVGFVVMNASESISFEDTQFEVWRLCFFIAGLPIIWWLGDFFMMAVVWGVEKTMFTWRNALYFCYAVRRPATNVIRAAAALGWWAGMMTIGNSEMNSALSTAYNVILKLWACVTLFMTANLLKVLLAKLLSSKFNKHSHLQKMHDSLRKEHMLHTLLQPRPKPQPSVPLMADGTADGTGGEEGSGPGGLLGGGELPAGVPATPPRRSASEGAGVMNPAAAAAEGREGAPPGARRSSSMPQHGAQQGAKPGKSFRTMLNFLRRGRQLSTIREEHTADEHEPGATSPPGTDAGLLDISIHGGASGLSTPRAAQHQQQQQQQQRSPLGSAAASPLKRGGGAGGAAAGGGLPPRSPGKLEPMGSGESALSRHTSISRHTVGGRKLSRQTSFARANRRQSGGLQRESRVSRQEDRQAEAIAVAVSTSMTSGRHQDEILAEKMVKMEKYIRKNALQVTFKDELTRVKRKEQVTSEAEARKLAFYLFWNVKADFSSRELTLKDLLDFFPTERGAQRAFDWLDADKDGTISLQDCCTAVVGVFKERANLAASLKDTKSVVGKLESLIGFVIHVIFGFIYLAIFNIDVMQTYLAFSSLVLAFSFIFNQSLRQMYENVVFLFVIHPYDVGDTLVIDSETYRVDEINIQFTTLLSGSNARVWYPNQKMMNAPFTNLTASGNKGESFKVLVDLDTPGTVLDEVRAVLEAHLRASPLEFNGVLGVNFNTSANPLKMTLNVYYEFSHNGVDGGRCNRARNKLFVLLASTLARLGVRYTWPEVRERYVAGPPSEADKSLATEAALAAAAAGAEPVGDELKQKLL